MGTYFLTTISPVPLKVADMGERMYGCWRGEGGAGEGKGGGRDG